MNAPKVDFIVLLGVLEITLILLVVALLFVLRSRSLARHVRSLQQQLRESENEPETVGFDQYLRDEIIRNQALTEAAAVAEDEDERHTAELLKTRKQFLELELAARQAERNPVEFRNRIVAGIQEVVATLRPQAEVHVVEGVSPDDTVSALEAKPVTTPDAAPARELHDTHDEEMDHLRQVINNQQDAMELLRARLADSGGSANDIENILLKLDEFERESRELHHSMEVLEAENRRLKQNKQSGMPASASPLTADTSHVNGLKSMLGKQQTTIANLENLIKELAPDAKKAAELKDALSSIERTNSELNGCVAVLEDENAMLRGELEEIRAFLDKQEHTARGENAGAAPDLPGDELQRELEIKVQELEALVEFKDAAIEALETQLNKLQSKYLADTGKKSTD